MASPIYYAAPRITDLWLADDCPPRYRRSVDRAVDPRAALDAVPERYRKAARRGARWRVAWVDPAGKRRARQFKTRDEAEGYARSLERGEVTGRNYASAPRTIAEAADAWLASKASLREGTRQRYQREIRCYITPMWGDVAPDAVASTDVQAWVNDLHSGHYPHTDGCSGDPMKRKTIRNIVSVVFGGIMAYAVRQGWAQNDPTEGIELPRNDTAPVKPLTPGELDRLLDAMYKHGEADGDLTLLLALTGIRIGEACALRVADVDRTARTITIERTWSASVPIEIVPPKNGRTRVVAYPPALDATMERRCEGRKADAWLIPGSRGTATMPSNWRQRSWRPVVRQIGLAATPHALRHTFATMAIEAGVSVKDLQAQLGHASATVTLDTYAAWWRTDLSGVAAAVSQRAGLSDGVARKPLQLRA